MCCDSASALNARHWSSSIATRATRIRRVCYMSTTWWNCAATPKRSAAAPRGSLCRGRLVQSVRRISGGRCARSGRGGSWQVGSRAGTVWPSVGLRRGGKRSANGGRRAVSGADVSRRAADGRGSAIVVLAPRGGTGDAERRAPLHAIAQLSMRLLSSKRSRPGRRPATTSQERPPGVLLHAIGVVWASLRLSSQAGAPRQQEAALTRFAIT